MIIYYAARMAKPEDYILEFLRRRPEGSEWVGVGVLQQEDVIPNGTPENYEQGLRALVESGRVRVRTVAT